jgi:hypothetical protein
MSVHRNTKFLLITGIISLIYFSVPVIQNYAYTYPVDRYNDYIIFKPALHLFQQMMMMAPNSIIPFIVQTIMALILWVILYGILRAVATNAPPN